MKEEQAMATMNTKCPICEAKMKYIDKTLVLNNGNSTRKCICENGHEFIERIVPVFKG